MKPKTEQEALYSLSALCATAEHCSREIEEKMRKWGLPEAVRKRLLTQLVKDGFIDDNRFCRAFVHDKLRYDQWGRRKIELALYRKGIPETIAGPILDEIPDTVYLETLRPLLAAKAKSTKAKSEYERNMKLLRYALGRGFSIDLARQCLPPGTEGDWDSLTDIEEEER